MPIKINKAWDEQRRNRRLFMELPVGVAVIAQYPDFFYRRPQFQAKTRNVSASGLALLAERPLPVGATVKLWIAVPISGESQTLKLRGMVVSASAREVTGTFLCHIQLSNRPEEAMRLWANTMFENIRRFNE